MSTTPEPGTAEQVTAVARILCDKDYGEPCFECQDTALSLIERGYAVVKRDDPAALADLNGGEWVQVDGMTARDAAGCGYVYAGEHYDLDDQPFIPEPIYIFVPRPTPMEGKQP